MKNTLLLIFCCCFSLMCMAEKSIKYLNACIGEGTLKDCTSPWDKYPM